VDENKSSIVDTADDINLCSNSRTLFGLFLIISIVSGDVVVGGDTLFLYV
jgi:hypothetical protein